MGAAGRRLDPRGRLRQRVPLREPAARRASRGSTQTGCVVYIGTFSKTVFPSLRLGYVIAPHGAGGRAPGRARRRPTAIRRRWSRRVLADFIGEGHYARHVRRMRRALRGAARRAPGRGRAAAGRRAAHSGSMDAGMHTVGWLPDGMDDRRVSEALLAAEVDAVPLSRYWMGPGARSGSKHATDEADEGGASRAERADDPQLLQHHHVRHETRRACAPPAGSCDDDGAAGAGEFDRLRERGGRLGGDVDDDIGQPAGGVAKRRDGIVDGNVDGQVGAEPRRQRQAGRRPSAPRPVIITNSAPASLAAAAAHSPRMPGPSTATTSPGPVPGIVAPQRIPAPKRIENRGDDRIERRRAPAAPSNPAQGTDTRRNRPTARARGRRR